MAGEGFRADLTRDYYSDLELPPTASVEDIKKQFKKLSLLWHPDRNPGREDQCVTRFQAIQSAHEVLTDKSERAKYDAGRFGKKSSIPLRNAREGPSTSLEEDEWATFSKQSQPPPSKSLGEAEISNKFSYLKGVGEHRSHDDQGAHQQESSSSSLNMMDSIRNQLVSDLALDLSSFRERIVEFRVSWGLLDFIDKELQEGQSLTSVLTISGSPQNAYATSCGSYLETFWPEVGQNMLVVIEEAWSTKKKQDKIFKTLRRLIRIQRTVKRYQCTIWVDLWQQDIGTIPDPNLAKFARVSVDGSAGVVVQIAQQIAWLGSVFRVPKYGSLSSSRAVLRKIGDDAIDISFLDLEPIENEGTQCWHPLFVNAVLAQGFPIPGRNGEIGIELPFELMTTLARTRYLSNFENGVVLRGFSTILFPTSGILSSNSVQWHCVSSAGGSKIPILEIRKYPWVKFTALEQVKQKRTFLGYYKRAYICLGTTDSSYATIDFSSAPREKPRLSLAGFTASLGVPKFGGPSISLNYTLTKGLMKTASASDFDGILLTAKELSFVIYDTESRRGWLVPAPSVILHLALTWAHHNPSLVRAPIIAANASWDGRSEALAALRANALSRFDGEGHPRPEIFEFDFKGLISRLWDGIEMIFDAKAEIDGKELKRNVLRGWEFMSIVHGTPNKQPKETEVDGLWHKLSSDPNIVVLFCQGSGDAIKPDLADPDSLSCRFRDHVPPGHGYLTGSVECLMKLSTQCGNKGECSQLTEGLYWPVDLSSPFDSCQHEQGLQCQLVQKLTKHPNDSTSIRWARNLAKEGAVVFGDKVAKLRKNQARPRREKLEVKSQPEKTKIIVVAAKGIQVEREAMVDEDRSSGTANAQD